MKKRFNIFSQHTKEDSQFINELLDKHELNFNELDFNHYDTDLLKAYNKLNSQLNENSSSTNKLNLNHFSWKPILKPLYTIALTSIVILAIIFLRRETDEQHYAEIVVEKGEKIKLNVDKNLTIWINAQSYVKIPTNGKVGNEIYVEGEVFIEAGAENEKMYSIKSEKAVYKLKNGALNIKTSADQIVATVSKGTVKFYNIKLPKSTQVTLNSNDKATLFKKLDFIAIETDKNKNYLFWKTGILEFNNTELTEVAKTVSEYFEIPVQIENIDLKNQPFSATFTNPEIDDILDKIQSSINCKISGDGSKLIIH